MSSSERPLYAGENTHENGWKKNHWKGNKPFGIIKSARSGHRLLSLSGRSPIPRRIVEKEGSEQGVGLELNREA